MILIRRHCFRIIYIALGLLILTACQPSNVRSQSQTSNPTQAAIVIALDLTKSSPLDNNQDMATLLEGTPALESNTASILESPKPNSQPTIIDIHRTEPALPQQLNQQLQQIYQTPKPIRQSQLLAMAQKLLAQGHAQSSARLLDQINLDNLEKALLGRYFETRAETQLTLGNSFGAIVWLHQAQLLTPATQPTIISKRLALKAQAYELNGRALPAATTLIELSQTLVTQDPTQYNQRIWRSLTKVSKNALQQHAAKAASDTARAWYNLALLPLNYHDLHLQLNALKQWQQQWPTHPAALKPPKDLQNLADLNAHQPRRIALAIPLEGRLGKVGKAVIDGFMAARFEAHKKQGIIPYIKVYDTTQLHDLDALYQQASDDQIEMIIGPLDKEEVVELSQREALPIPTLALNYVPLESNHKLTTNLMQFGLVVEDESAQLAKRNWAQGHKRILILHQDQAWAIRAARHFKSTWDELGGQIVSQVSFSGAGDHSKAITQALLINQSHDRSKILKQILSGSSPTLKFEPRRRQDIDAIVLFALPEDGRQIIPTLAFHYAANLPVYASHHIYQGPTKTNRDRDLNKVIFTELPWMIEQPEIQKTISHQWPQRQRYNRLFAIGVDAYRLFPRLEQLQAYSDSRVHGVTGLLQMNAQGRIVTERSWGQFKGGKIIVNPRVIK
ncbi:MAG: penicillin-binding protein activator [Gammaproteobacteria bacterium]|nr:penicillin-binding protein activator [Gammaproteobacteria bacterium]